MNTVYLNLFSGQHTCATLTYCLHSKKGGQAFAVLPGNPVLQAKVAYLLPAQSIKARVYRLAVQTLSSFGSTFPASATKIRLAPNNKLWKFLEKSVGQEISFESPPVILPGNPAVPSQRIIFIPIDTSGEPLGTAKIGISSQARSLVRTEYNFLLSLPPALRAWAPIPTCFAETENFVGFGMKFVQGKSPRWPVTDCSINATLSSWINLEREICIEVTDLWKSLTKSLERRPTKRVEAWRSFARAKIHPCLFHGDFVPWNVREPHDGSWGILDWERGELTGIPGWDWLHFVIQPAILVKKWPVDRILAHARRTLNSRVFQNYLARGFPEYRSEIAEILLRTYLVYNQHVLKPTEQIEAHAALAEWAIQ